MRGRRFPMCWGAGRRKERLIRPAEATLYIGLSDNRRRGLAPQYKTDVPLTPKRIKWNTALHDGTSVVRPADRAAARDDSAARPRRALHRRSPRHHGDLVDARDRRTGGCGASDFVTAGPNAGLRGLVSLSGRLRRPFPVFLTSLRGKG